ncbi:uncharacterized protein Z518_06008 [Rhinocladiella mackenziei CBS 650.93]|uniref:Mid2 domain-containing protein n=1 Tax=Rhinocladiella mackenziei CBS 650.93 TaxID=1442369 RepID=A0A0D2IPP9_9EURO|nr:uncharacterized protein Z518_06008 [Rhinocladiella mackenziei CBS 650.93]KIX05136.1 hypothetical protein Z518_06008 [Rhinocladiella mackenziei CBS 650.93]
MADTLAVAVPVAPAITTTYQRAAAKTIPVSPITSAPIIFTQRDLIRRAEDTIDDNTCGWVNGDYTTFAGPEGYTYLSCTSSSGPTQTIALTYDGGNATMENLPRYFSDFWYSSSGSAIASSLSSASATSSASSSSTPESAASDVQSWLDEHKGAIIGGIAGLCVVVALLVFGCICVWRRRRVKVSAGSGGKYAPASQQMPHQEAYQMQSQGAYQPSYQGNFQSQPYDGAGVYVPPHR